MTRRATGEDGFTLIEMLVAIGLLALMMGYAYSAISTFRHIKRAEETGARRRAVDSAQRHLRQSIEGARVTYTFNEGETRILFEGRPDSLVIAAQLDDRLVQGGLQRLRYGLEQDSLRLTYAVKRDASPEAGRTESVLDGVTALAFSYYGAAEEGAEPRWQKDWPRRDALPALVRIEADLAQASPAQWPPLTVAIEASR
jgi:prepilin-type N-terminal cleavage/methylation domain-containing protein